MDSDRTKLSNTDPIKVIRLISYEGPRDHIEKILAKSLVGEKGRNPQGYVVGDTIIKELYNVEIPR